MDAPSLQNISFNLKSNKLLAVIGPVGAGKVSHLFVLSYGVRKQQHSAQVLIFLCASVFIQSSLLSSILGELPGEKGVLNVKGQLTYASQQPWVYPGTIRSNILFGKDMNPQKYERVIKACALKRVRVVFSTSLETVITLEHLMLLLKWHTTFLKKSNSHQHSSDRE